MTLAPHMKPEINQSVERAGEQDVTAQDQAVTAPPRNEGERIAPAQKHHFRELDSLRGVASVAVVLYHWFHLFPDSAIPRAVQLLLVVTPLQLVTRGHSAVVLFLVLSGFVLALPQVRGSKVHYFTFIVKRICRVYLPYVVALAFAVLGCWRFHGLMAYDPWFERTWHQAPTLKLVLQHLLLVGEYPNDAYNTAFWSLVQEMRISLFFPALCWLILRTRIPGAVVAMGALFSAEVYAEHHGLLSYEELRTLVCIADFIAGILLALYLPRLRAWLKGLHGVAYWMFFVLSLVLFIYFPWFAYHVHVTAQAIDGGIAAGGVGVILFSLTDHRVSALLLKPVVSFVGRVSYSLYLLHGTVLFLFAYVVHGRIPLTVWLVPYLLVSMVGATVMYRWVELPSIALGKFLARRLEARPRPVDMNPADRVAKSEAGA